MDVINLSSISCPSSGRDDRMRRYQAVDRAFGRNATICNKLVIRHAEATISQPIASKTAQTCTPFPSAYPHFVPFQNYNVEIINLAVLRFSS